MMWPTHHRSVASSGGRSAKYPPGADLTYLEPCRHTVYMASSTSSRKPLGVRATPEEHQRIVEAARREQRSVNSFVLRAALQAAEAAPGRPTAKQVQAAIKRAQDLMRPYRK